MGLVQYEEVLVEAGYDDIDFISDISGDELQDIGITKNGQLLDNIHTYSWAHLFLCVPLRPRILCSISKLIDAFNSSQNGLYNNVFIDL